MGDTTIEVPIIPLLQAFVFEPDAVKVRVVPAQTTEDDAAILTVGEMRVVVHKVLLLPEQPLLFATAKKQPALGPRAIVEPAPR